MAPDRLRGDVRDHGGIRDRNPGDALFRGRAGKVLVMNQDYLLLLTNLAIGLNQQLRFQELLQAFRARGVYFDKQSEQRLIDFYEHVGNVDRMSDSGDAVYVTGTI